MESFQEDKPFAYQEVEGQDLDLKVEVEAAYSLEGEGSDGAQFGFRVGDYDKQKVLVLDPVVLLYAGYIGGSDSDQGLGIAVTPRATPTLLVGPVPGRAPSRWRTAFP